MSERLASALRDVEWELEETTSQLRLLTEKVEHLRKARDGLRGLLGIEEAPPAQAESARGAGSPSNLREGISRVLLDARRRMTGHEIEEELRRRDWAGKSPSGSIYEATRRMAIDGQEVTRVGRNVYIHKEYVEPQEAEDPAEAGSSKVSLLPRERRTTGDAGDLDRHPAPVVGA